MKHTATIAKGSIKIPVSDHTWVDQSLRNSEIRYRRLFESAQDGILILNAETGAISDVNPFLIDMLGYSREEFVEKKLWEVGAFKDIEASRNSFLALKKNKFIRYENLPLKTKDGRLVQVEFVSNVYLVGDEKVIQCNIRDISDRKRAEAALRAKEEAHWSMIENLEDHWMLIKNLPVGVVVYAPDTRIVLCNPEASQLLGVSSDQMLGKKARDPVWRFVREDGTRMPVNEFPVKQVIATGHVLKNFVLGFALGRDGEYRWVLVNAYPQFDDEELLRQVVVTFADISDIKSAEERNRRHIEHLAALVENDRAINFSFDLNLSLKTLLTHVLVQLGVDAADVLLFNPTARTLEYVAGRGFHSRAIEHARQPLGEGYAGRAAQDRSIVHIPDLAKEHDNYLRGILLAGENFVSYHGVPLIAKGQIMGVLEVFHRTRLVRDEEWLDFLKALASQAAIAIDNVTLFDNLQHSNTELFQAYDATIEGWSRALELRDDETEGHAQRVAVLTVKLARLFGLSDAELVQVRWGALLHDIGKMAIPDGILLKHDTLTKEEWVVMKKHTVFAFEMLSPIRYLRSALDIPYAHHEKWDGSGYPLGLKGEQIPLVARIFAVADVWDALRSDRRYRSSWSVAKVRKHLRSLAGTHFDPRVVKMCLDSDVLVEKKTTELH
ncbi:MAG: PAS domain S-box protein [Desulfuromonadales bacterium]|nr:PAS domain S-box protein [Desulfuromonadales bacterium]